MTPQIRSSTVLGVTPSFMFASPGIVDVLELAEKPLWDCKLVFAESLSDPRAATASNALSLSSVTCCHVGRRDLRLQEHGRRLCGLPLRAFSGCSVRIVSVPASEVRSCRPVLSLILSRGFLWRSAFSMSSHVSVCHCNQPHGILCPTPCSAALVPTTGRILPRWWRSMC